MVNYKCNICGKIFNRKSNWEYHEKNKKKPCKPNNNDNIKIAPKLHQTAPNCTEEFETNIICKSKKNQDTTLIYNKLYINCNYCGLIFSRKSALTRHLKDRCNVKKLEEDKKEKIFNKLLEREEKFEILINNFENLQESNKKSQNENKLLKKQIGEFEKKLKKQTKIYDEKIKNIISKNITKNITNNNNIIQNIIIPSDRLVKFGQEDLTKINNKNFIEVMSGYNVVGRRMFIELLKLIHFNEHYPEYQNVYMTDKNREHYMVYNGKTWELNKECINDILYQIENISDIKIEELKVNKNIMDKIIKYKNLYFDNDDDIDKERKKQFIEMIDDSIKNYLYNNKNIPINNYTKLTNDLLIKN